MRQDSSTVLLVDVVVVDVDVVDVVLDDVVVVAEVEVPGAARGQVVADVVDLAARVAVAIDLVAAATPEVGSAEALDHSHSLLVLVLVAVAGPVVVAGQD